MQNAIECPGTIKSCKLPLYSDSIHVIPQPRSFSRPSVSTSIKIVLYNRRIRRQINMVVIELGFSAARCGRCDADACYDTQKLIRQNALLYQSVIRKSALNFQQCTRTTVWSNGGPRYLGYTAERCHGWRKRHRIAARYQRAD